MSGSTPFSRIRAGLAAPVLPVLSGLILSGCLAAPPQVGPEPVAVATPYPLVSQPAAVIGGVLQPPRGIQGAAYSAADAMVTTLIREPGLLEQGEPILPASFVNDDNLDQSSALGRIIARQMGSRFAQNGYAVTEMKMRKNLVIRQGEGEFLLSRELDKLKNEYNVKAVLTGSYTVSRNQVMVTAQLLRLHDQRILTSQDFTLPLAGNVQSLLNSEGNRQAARLDQQDNPL